VVTLPACTDKYQSQLRIPGRDLGHPALDFRGYELRCGLLWFPPFGLNGTARRIGHPGIARAVVVFHI
jgi:hypothetical protein